MEIKRGQIYYVSIDHNTGCEIAKDRPGVVVSCDTINAYNGTVMVVMCSAATHRIKGYHADLRSTPQRSTALCDHLYAVDKSRLGTMLGTVTEREMADIENGISYALFPW